MTVDDHLCPYKGADCYAREKQFVNNISNAAMTNRVTAAFFKKTKSQPRALVAILKGGASRLCPDVVRMFCSYSA